MNWFRNLLPSKIRSGTGRARKGVPEGLWTKCEICSAILYSAELERSLFVCPKCNHHHYIAARIRLQHFLDPDNTSEIGEEIGAQDILKFRDSKKYKDRLSNATKETGETEALVVMQGLLCKMPIVGCAFEYKFIGGSMGSGVGERFVRAVNRSLELEIPLVCFSSSGGARMQEGLLSLLQMSKTSAALARLSNAKIPYISVLTDPTMGGVAASLAMLGDIIIAEPNARVGFAGARVIQQTMRETLPEGFQKSEFLLEHGAIDMITDRRELRATIAALIAKLSRKSVPVEDKLND